MKNYENRLTALEQRVSKYPPWLLFRNDDSLLEQIEKFNKANGSNLTYKEVKTWRKFIGIKEFFLSPNWNFVDCLKKHKEMKGEYFNQ